MPEALVPAMFLVESLGKEVLMKDDAIVTGSCT